MIVKFAQKFPRVLSWSLVAVLLSMPVWPFLSTWFGDLFGAALLWKSLPALVVFCAGLATIVYLVFFNRKLLKSLFRDRLVVIIVAFSVLVLVSLFLMEATRRAQLAGIAMDLRFFAVFLLGFVVVKIDAKFWKEVFVKLPVVAIWYGVVLSVIGVVQVLFLPADFLTHFGYSASTIAPSISIDSTDTLRAFATLRGPNDYAAFLIIPFLFSVWRFLKTKNGWFLASGLVILAGLFVSSSRSAWLGALIATAFMLAVGFLSQKILRSRKFWLSCGAVVLVCAVVSVALIQVPFIRLNVLHIDTGRNQAVITSNDAHTEALNDGIDRVVNEPLGCGVGCAGPASFYSDQPLISENYYLQIAEQYGVVGLLLWLAIIGVIAWRMWSRRRTEIGAIWLSALIGYMLIGLFLHVFADEPLVITWFAIAGVLIGGEHGSTK